MSKHTPGPWMILPVAERGQFVVLTENGPRLDIAETYGWPDTPREANAKLIAASPDLLSALQGLLTSLEADGRWGGPNINAARAAIDKATK